MKKIKFPKRAHLYFKIFGAFQGLVFLIRAIFQPHRKVVARHNGIPISVRLNSTDIYVLTKVLKKQDYEIDLAKPPAIIIDAGAYIGLTSIFFTQKYPDAKIFAIEPDPSNFELLQENTAQFKNITPINKALWYRDENVAIYDRSTGNWGFAISSIAENTNNHTGQIEGISLLSIMKTYNITHIDLLKLDIEGSEKELFEHCGDWIEKVGIIVAELHERIKPGCEKTFFDATSFFEKEIQKGENIFKIRQNYI